eukprot:3250591-Rhodomonas_salina.3
MAFALKSSSSSCTLPRSSTARVNTSLCTLPHSSLARVITSLCTLPHSSLLLSSHASHVTL